MKIFWSIIGLLTLGMLGLVVTGGESNESPEVRSVSTESAPRETPAPLRRPVDDATPAAEAEQVSRATPSPVVTPPPADNDDNGATPTVADATDIESELDDLAHDLIADADAAAAADMDTEPTIDAGDSTALATSDNVSDADGGSIAPVADAPALVHNEDGTITANGRYTITGNGEEATPYEVTWDMLVGVSEHYQPREGRTKIPEWVQMMHEKHVKITGYMAFPAAMGQVDEALVMLNQWDGCCIGVPPSPFDSVEVWLVKPATVKAHGIIPYGSVTGIFKVDPYLVQEWLVGLYLMEDAELSIGM